jgi:tetratricopeptide (TPR) repeat protein
VAAPDPLPLVFSRPRRALALARAVLSGAPTDDDASIAHQAIGIVYREFGDVSASIRHLRDAVRLARRAGSADRSADSLASLGVALIHNGRTGPGLAALAQAVAISRGHLAARVRYRRAGALWILGRYAEGMADLRHALPALRRAGDLVWAARALNLRALIHTALGAAVRADADLLRAEALFANTRQEHDRALAIHNRGLVAFRRGDLPLALCLLDQSEQRLDRLGTPDFGLHLDRSEVLLAAGLAGEALAEADSALRRLDSLRGQATRRAQLLLAAAQAALACNDYDSATARAGLAGRMFARQHRAYWRSRAQLLLLHARFAAGDASVPLLTAAARLAADLAAGGSAERVHAHVLAGRFALVLARFDDAERHLAVAARARHRGPALSRLDGWLAEALRANARADVRRMLYACRRGLDVLDEHRLTLGAAEMRARAGDYGVELTALAVGACLRAGRNRELLRWSERGRCAALAVPPVRPPADRRLRALLTAFRDVADRLDSMDSGHPGAERLRHERLRLEQEIRARAHRAPGRGVPDDSGAADPAVLLDRLGATQLLEIVDVDGALHILVCGHGRVRRLRIGPASTALSELAFARAMLRRAAYTSAHGHIHGATSRLDAGLQAAADRLETALLGPAVRCLIDQPIVIVPSGRLQGVPWALLPSLRERVHSVVPSATAWLRAASRPRPRSDSVVLVRGPGLRTGGAEVTTLARCYPAATVFEPGTAISGRVLTAIDGSSLAHIAAHGTFRGDSPLFSSLRLTGGPITVHDLERLRRAPYRLVLPSCDSGQLGQVGEDEQLGLAAALLPHGTAGIVASVLPVNDEATVALMLALHEGLRAGATMASALRDARIRTPDTPVDRATAWSFVAIGPA